MRVGLLVPSLYMRGQVFRKRISAPMELAVTLTNALTAKGIEVTFFSGPDIPVSAPVVTADENLLTTEYRIDYQQDLQPEAYDAVSFYEKKKYFELSVSEKAYQLAKEKKLDIIHVYHAMGNLAHYFAELFSIPTLYTLHVSPPPKGTLDEWRYERFHNQNFVAISNSQKHDFLQIVPNMNIISMIYHGIDTTKYLYEETPHDSFAFIGRLIPQKGLDIAIQAIRETHSTLQIATHVNPVIEKSLYYQEKIKPFIDGQSIIFNDLLQEKEKIMFLQQAKAFLFPLQWNEPFGMVLIESLACGTPVIAFNRGSVPEIVVDGETGFLVNPEEGQSGIVAAIQKLNGLSPAAYRQMRLNCRERVDKLFTVEHMTTNYIQLYQQLLSVD